MSSFANDLFVPHKEFSIIAVVDGGESCAKVSQMVGDSMFYCLSNYMVRNSGCSLPWHPDPTLPPCETAAQYDAVSKLSLNVSKSTSETIVSMTGCRPSCKKRIFDARHIFSQKNFDGASWSALSQEQAQLTLFYSSGVYEEQDQYLAYDLNTFTSDVGGQLGLLLGYSLLAFYDMAKTIAVWCHGWVSEKPAEVASGSRVSRVSRH